MSRCKVQIIIDHVFFVQRTHLIRGYGLPVTATVWLMGGQEAATKHVLPVTRLISSK